ncbi:MAG TPA: hypothetical protein VJC07_04745 [Candidatus Nanoarchaeia archaeon]|nr:hypothetical protein [Candidatus Nanoarchaeia archaeon]
METIEIKPKKWGNSLGFTIPKEIVEKERLSTKKRVRITITSLDNRHKLKEMFGTLKFDKPTQQIMDEIDEGYDD